MSARRVRPVTSREVARVAGVSQAAVSHALNGSGGGNIRVSEATRARIQKIADELGYAANPSAQALRRGRSGILGFLPRSSAHPFRDPVPYHLAAELTRVARQRGFHLVGPTEEDPATRHSGDFAEFLVSLRVDGVIVFWPEDAQELRRLLELGIPVVQILRVDYTVETPTIVVDPAQGMAAAVQHLLDLGHTRLAYIGVESASPVDTNRLKAFRETVLAGGIELPDAYVRLGTDYSIEQGLAHTLELINTNPRPSAILAAGDNLSLVALRALHRARIFVPDDISLISYDGILGEHLYPQLTSVAQPFADVAARAVTMLLKLLETPPGQASGQVVLPSTLVVRESTTSPRVDASKPATTKGGSRSPY